jgi:hypothetical protein
MNPNPVRGLPITAAVKALRIPPVSNKLDNPAG